MIELIPLLLFLCVCILLMLGFPVAFTLAGTALVFAGFGIIGGVFDPNLLRSMPDRLYGTMTNYTLVAVPLFVLMGVMLEKSRIAEDLLQSMAQMCGRLPGGLGISVIIVGALLAASTGIVGATVVTMGLISLPTLLKHGYSPAFATGTICATGTLGQIIPPSIALVLLGDILSSAYQQAQLNAGITTPQSITVGDLFVAAIVPGLILVSLYCILVMAYSFIKAKTAITLNRTTEPNLDSYGGSLPIKNFLLSLVAPLLLMVCVLGSIVKGAATPTEAAGIGALGATILALFKQQLTLTKLMEVTQSTTRITAMVFVILIGASMFSLVFRGFGGDSLIESFFHSLPGGVFTAVLIVMVVVFFLGFILDFIEITFVVVPIVGPILLAMDINPLWLGIMLALNLQTSFLTPPFGFALFYLRGVAPSNIATSDIYRGVVPFVAIQLILLILLTVWPSLVTWLPDLV